MLPKLPCSITSPVTFSKYTAPHHTDVSHLGAFSRGESIRFEVTCPRSLGVTAVVLRIHRDGCPDTDEPFGFVDHDLVKDTEAYAIIIDTDALCQEAASGLFYYRLVFVRGADTLFSDTVNNVDMTLVPHGGNDFRLLIYEPDFAPPAWFGEGVMYHIFVDRFCRGQGDVDLQKDRGNRPAILNPDWAHGVPEYPPYPGANLPNNTVFGGNLWGICEKLDYLASLGVKVIYLSPIFKAYSNHKYDTGDYMTVDPGFGGTPALDRLIEQAHAHGMRVILDGVFNHTGDDSRYFNRYGTYDTVGAWQSEDSPFADWFIFKEFPHRYESWWGIPIMPRLNHASPACRRFFTDTDGVCAQYIKRGVDGWRLDVADELSDRFLDELRVSVKAASADRPDGEAVIIGEVWENAADKIAYGERRRYFRGAQLDSVMNYPVRSGILAFVRDGDAEVLYHTLTELYGSYPRAVSDALMNLLGTHDTERILTVLGADPEEFDRPNEWMAHATLPENRKARALGRLRMAATLQFTVFGIPSIYYGDEVGMEGFHDPFCRRPFPWQEIDTPARAELLAFYRALGELRKSPAFKGGDFRILAHGKDYIAYERTAVGGGESVMIAANRGGDTVRIPLPADGTVILASGEASVAHGMAILAPDSVCVIRKNLV